MSGYSVDLGALKAAEQGMDATIGELRKAGFHGQERSGHTVQAWKLDVDETGHQVITDGLNAFLDRAGWWIRGLIADTEDTVRALADTRAWYEKTEQDIADGLTSLLSMTFGNPMGERQQAAPPQCPPQCPPEAPR